MGLICEDAIRADGRERETKKEKEKEKEKETEREIQDTTESAEEDKTFVFLFQAQICLERFLSFLIENKWEEAIRVFVKYFIALERFYPEE